MNFCTDGDPVHRIVMHNYLKHELSEASLIYECLQKLRLLDLTCGPAEETVSFDPKHLVKRWGDHLQ